MRKETRCHECFVWIAAVSAACLKGVCVRSYTGITLGSGFKKKKKRVVCLVSVRANRCPVVPQFVVFSVSPIKA